MNQAQDCQQDTMALPQVSLHDTLSKIINQLSQILRAAQRLLLIKQEASDLAQNQMLQVFQQKLGGSLLCADGRGEELLHRSVRGVSDLKRFSCRIMELLALYKQKADSHELLAPLGDIVTKLQAALVNLHQLSQFPTFARQAGYIFNNFKLLFRRRVTKRHSLGCAEDNAHNTIDNSILFTTSRQIKARVFEPELQYQKKARMITNTVNSRFKTLDCLELDYGYFKNSYLLARTAADLYQSYSERNQPIDSQIKQYQRSYNEYINKRAKRKSERNAEAGSNQLKGKLSLDKGLVKIGRGVERNSTIDVNKISEIKINSWAVERESPKTIYGKKFNASDDAQQNSYQNKEKLFQKTRYEMKNVTITANHIKIEPSFNAGRGAKLKSTLRQVEFYKKRVKKVCEVWPLLKNMRQLSDTAHPSQ